MGDDYRSRFDGFKNVEAEKNDLIRALLDQFDHAKKELSKAKLDLASEQDTRRRLQQDLSLAQKRNDRRQYVVVLIDADADAYTFHDKFLSLEMVGGEAVAKELLKQIKQYLDSIQIDGQSIDVIVKAFANVEGLAQALIRQDRLRSASQFRSFLTGFTSQLALFDFVDVGAGKEHADNKIRENLKFYIDSWQCKQVLLGCCHDSGYTSFLTDLVANNAAQDRITLLTTNSLSPRLMRLGLRTARFETVFARQNSLPTESEGTRVDSRRSGSTVTKIAGIMRIPNVQCHRLGPIQRRGDGQRTDKAISVDQKVVDRIGGKNLCHWLYLRGECKGCGRDHTHAALTDEEFDAVWFLSRKARCFTFQKGKDCNDSKCIYGHAPPS